MSEVDLYTHHESQEIAGKKIYAAASDNLDWKMDRSMGVLLVWTRGSDPTLPTHEGGAHFACLRHVAASN